MPEKNVNQLLEIGPKRHRNSLFFLMTFDENKKIKWRQIMGLNNVSKLISNDLEFDRKGLLIEKYNLQGIQIVCTGLTWAPYNIHENCNENGRGCSNSGFLVDMIQIWAKEYNFTWDIYADVEGDWGLKPISGRLIRSYTR